MNLFIPAAFAADAGPVGGIPFDFLLIGVFVAVFYFLIWRPQSRRTREHRELMGSLGKGDEIVTSGGVLGRISRVDGEFITVEVAEGVELRMQKGAVAAALPKGTLKSINDESSGGKVSKKDKTSGKGS